MSEKNNLQLLFDSYAVSETPVIIELDNKDRIPVASINLRELSIENYVLCETTSSPERYCLATHGIRIYFTYFRKMTA